MDNFIDELLAEAEAEEFKLHLAHVDLVLVEISNLNEEIQKNFTQAEEEKRLIDEWALSKNSKLQDRIDWMTRKLEAFMKEQGDDVKTIDLPNGKLLRRKQPDKIEIVDMEKFMLNADQTMISIIPEIVKPDMNKIKAFYKRSMFLPEGTKLIVGKENFSIKLKQRGEEENGKTETRVGVEQTGTLKNVI